MYPFLHFSFEDSRPCRFVKLRDFQNVCRIDPFVGAPAHDMVSSAEELVDRDLAGELVISFARMAALHTLL